MTNRLYIACTLCEHIASLPDSDPIPCWPESPTFEVIADFDGHTWVERDLSTFFTLHSHGHQSPHFRFYSDSTADPQVL